MSEPQQLLPQEMTADLFHAIAEYTYDWETWVDTRGTTRWINDAVERITGYSVAECLSLPDYPLSLACEADRPILERVLSDAGAGGSGNDVEFRVLTKAGALRWVAISWQSVRSAQSVALGYRTSIRDVDERKEMEQELHRLRRRAEALALARSELLANVSHELRSPAHCIAGFAELLLQEPLGEKQRHYVSVILDQCRSMQRQVEDLLSLSALEAGGVELAQETVDDEALVQGLVEVSQPTAKANGLSLHADVQVENRFIEADGSRLSQILRNLIDNALKFTERGSVELRVRSSDASDSPRLCFQVIDTGAGMRQDQVDTLLMPFRQGPAARSRGRAGVGLGLAIVQRLVNAMGGELSIQSQVQVGTRVHVSLPLVRARLSAHERVNEPSSQAPLRSGHALVVDDSPAARELLSGLLASCGFSSAQADCADAARTLVSEQHFDIIFIDYQMPDRDGAETALLLRRSLSQVEPGHHVPIFIVTANVFAHEQLRGARAYVNGILPKPLSRSALGRVLAQLSEPAPAAAAPVLRDDVVHDLASTLHQSGKTLLQHLLPATAADITTLRERAAEALKRRAADDLRRAAHDLAGQAALMGAAHAASLAQQLEVVMEQAGELAFAAAEPLLTNFSKAWLAAHERLSERALHEP